MAHLPRPVLALILALLVAAALPLTGGVAVASASGVVISELRVRGPAGGNDELVELGNAGGDAVDISGWRLQGCAAASGAPSERATVPSGTVLEPGQHFLFTNAAAGGYSGAVAGDATYTTGISDTGGVRITSADGTAVDGVASADGRDQCREGQGLTFPTSDGDNGFERRAGGTQDTDDNAADFEGPKPSDPQNLGGGSGPGPDPSLTLIHEIQGSGDTSPLAGRTVTIEGVVTGWDDEIGANFERTFPEDAGLFVQEEPADADGDQATSEAVFAGFVRDRQAFPPGSVVRLEGQVKEKFGLTMIAETIDTEPTVVGTAAVPEPVVIDPAAAQAQDPVSRPYYESLESMRVRLATGTANSGGTNKFGELFLTPGTTRDRVFRTEAAPDLLATDADAGAGDPDNPFDNPEGSSTQVDGDLFDRVDDVVGPFAFSFGHYKVMVQPDRLPTVADGPIAYPYDGLAPPAPRQLRVASLNVENHLAEGSELDLSVVSAEEEAEKRARIADAIDQLLLRPDVVAVQEVENLALLEELAAELGGYQAFLEEGNDERGIDVGFLVKDGVGTTELRQVGKEAAGPTGVTCSDVEGRLFDRPPLALDVSGGSASLTVFSNHFSSKAAPDACRRAQAAFLAEEVAAIEAGGGQVVVAGDLNAFEDEEALAVLEERTSLTNQWSKAPEQERYSFAFSGKLQTLDHILVTDGLDARVEGFQYAHFNVDYHDRDVPADGHGVSDHDPPVLTLSTSACPGGDQRPSVVVDGVDSGVANRDTGDGCTIGDLIDEESNDDRPGSLVRHVESVTQELFEEGVIRPEERGRIVAAAGRAQGRRMG